MVAGSVADPDPHHFEKLDPYAHQSECGSGSDLSL
jgi:hypothetical protein